MLFVIDENGQCLQKNFTEPTPPSSVFREIFGPNIFFKEYKIDPLPTVDAKDIKALIQGGQVVGDPFLDADPVLWLHGYISGGTVNQLTGTRYIERGQTLTYSASLRPAQDSPPEEIVSHIPGTDPPEPVSGEWALELMHEYGLDQFSPVVTLTEGNLSGSVTIPDRLCDGLYKLPEERMAMIGPFKLRVADPVAFEFKIRS